MMRRAIGAAVCAPKPACSTTTTTTYFGCAIVPPNIADEQRRVALARDLRGTGLARDRDLVEREALERVRTRCPVGSVDRALEAREHRGARGRVECDVADRLRLRRA